MKNMRLKSTLALLACLAVGIVVFAATRTQIVSHKGQVVVLVSTPSLDDTTITLDGVQLEPILSSDNSATYQVTKGSHKVSVTKLGYMPFTQAFSVNTGKVTSIYAKLLLNSDSTITNAEQIGITNPTVRLLGVSYFYDKTWAVSQVQLAGTDPAYIIASYNAAQSVWETVAGPGTSFDDDTIANLPNDVQTYVQNNIKSYSSSTDGT